LNASGEASVPRVSERRCAPNTAFKTKTFVLKAGKKRIVHVVAKTLAENLATGTHRPLVAVRRFGDAEPALLARHVEILGPSTLFHTPDAPLPGTSGRGIAYLVTTAALRVHVDVE
jgi:hypothetical protein